MRLFKKSTSNELKDKLDKLITDYNTQLESYEHPVEKAHNRAKMSSGLALMSGLTGVATIPSGMMAGAYLGMMGAGSLVGAIIPAALAAGSGILLLINHKLKDKTGYTVEANEYSKEELSKFNKNTAIFFGKIEHLDMGSALDDIKKVVEDSTKEVHYNPSKVTNEIRNIVKRKLD